MIIELISFISTIAFGASGALVAAKHRMDVVGMMFLACITGVGGGTLRDIILDVDVFWLLEWHYITTCVAVSIVVYIYGRKLGKFSTALVWADAVGMALFSVLGTMKALEVGIGPMVAPILGMFGACLGGVVRDIMVNEIPMMMQKEIYVTAALMGGLTTSVCFTWLNFTDTTSILVGGTTALLIRGLALIKNISLPPHPGID